MFYENTEKILAKTKNRHHTPMKNSEQYLRNYLNKMTNQIPFLQKCYVFVFTTFPTKLYT